MIAGLDTPSTGRILIGDRDVTHLPPAERRISMVFQSYALFPHLNVRENILFCLRVRRQSARDHERRLSRVAKLLGLPYFASAFGIFLLRQTFKTIPRELEEAAQVEGASALQVLLKVYVPLARPIYLAYALVSGSYSCCSSASSCSRSCEPEFADKAHRRRLTAAPVHYR